MNDCLFCRIAAGNTTDAVVLYQNAELLVFLDVAPIRRGHIDIIPREHYEGLELIPHRLAGSIMVLGQDLAKRLKATYGVQRVAFLFTGGDVPHAHAHVIPMHYKTDVTSARYILNPEHVEWGSAHLRAERDSLLEVRSELGFPP